MEHQEGQSVDNEAIQWFVILQDEAATEEDKRLFDIWRMSDAKNDIAWREVQRMWSGLDQLSPKHLTHSEQLMDRDIPIGAISIHNALRRRHLSPGKIALSACLFFTAAIGWQLTPVGLMADYRSGVGERRTVQLKDGSTIELATASAMDVDISKERRSVKLLSGEAFFTIAKDPLRPFVVETEQGQIKVLGTAFNVRIENGVTVAVTHNTVEISTKNTPPFPLKEGKIVHFDDDSVSPVETADLDTVQAWRQDQIVFIDTPLKDVISELQRYNTGHIQLLNRNIGELRVTGVFDSRRANAALDTIAESLNLKVFRLTNLLIGITQN